VAVAAAVTLAAATLAGPEAGVLGKPQDLGVPLVRLILVAEGVAVIMLGLLQGLLVAAVL
jgi:hypothetical protein